MACKRSSVRPRYPPLVEKAFDPQTIEGFFYALHRPTSRVSFGRVYRQCGGCRPANSASKPIPYLETKPAHALRFDHS